MNIRGFMPGSRGLLPAPSPLRTGHEIFTSSGSSIDKASFDCGLPKNVVIPQYQGNASFPKFIVNTK